MILKYLNMNIDSGCTNVEMKLFLDDSTNNTDS